MKRAGRTGGRLASSSLGELAADWPPLEGGGSKLPQERLPMRKIKEVLRLQSLGLSQRQIAASRSEEHTSELQSPCNLVCRLLLEKKKQKHDKSGAVTAAACHDITAGAVDLR